MVIAVIILALLCAYLYYMLANFIVKQLDINRATYEAFKAMTEWNDDIVGEISKANDRIEKAEITAGNASNKATTNAKKIERMQGYAEH